MFEKKITPKEFGDLCDSVIKISNSIGEIYRRRIEVYSKIKFDKTELNSNEIKELLKLNELEKRYILRYINFDNLKIEFSKVDKKSAVLLYKIKKLTKEFIDLELSFLELEKKGISKGKIMVMDVLIKKLEEMRNLSIQILNMDSNSKDTLDEMYSIMYLAFNKKLNKTYSIIQDYLCQQSFVVLLNSGMVLLYAAKFRNEDYLFPNFEALFELGIGCVIISQSGLISKNIFHFYTAMSALIIGCDS